MLTKETIVETRSLVISSPSVRSGKIVEKFTQIVPVGIVKSSISIYKASTKGLRLFPASMNFRSWNSSWIMAKVGESLQSTNGAHLPESGEIDAASANWEKITESALSQWIEWRRSSKRRSFSTRRTAGRVCELEWVPSGTGFRNKSLSRVEILRGRRNNFEAELIRPQSACFYCFIALKLTKIRKTLVGTHCLTGRRDWLESQHAHSKTVRVERTRANWRIENRRFHKWKLFPRGANAPLLEAGTSRIHGKRCFS